MNLTEKGLDNMTRYVRCNCCNKRIYFGEEVFRFKGYCGVYCSDECFADAFGEVQELDIELAEKCCCTVYDDDARRRELQEQMERLLREMNDCKAEFDSLCNNTR